MRLPNLLVPGTQKGGTTTIHRILSAHPDVYMSGNKEPGLFHNRSEVTADELHSYAAHFSNAPIGSKYIGEATAHYFWEKNEDCKFSRRNWRAKSNVPLIKKTLDPKLSIILTLRHPVQRAISAYNHHATRGRIAPDETIMQAGERAELGIIDLGFYRRHYIGWRDGLPEARFFLTTTDELKNSTLNVYQRLMSWLVLPVVTIPEDTLNTRWNSSRRMRERAGVQQNTPAITADDKNRLSEIYLEEIRYWKGSLPGASEWTEES